MKSNITIAKGVDLYNLENNLRWELKTLQEDYNQSIISVSHAYDGKQYSAVILHEDA